ncbi:MAG: hypothetical protein KJ077_13605 [Anaerolineae bacterium]|nr:hypothetical protein [Anaerolineae bacterium]
MEQEKLELQAARYSFGQLSTQEMQNLVDGLLNEGIYADEFLNVIYPKYDTREIVGAAFEKSLKVLEIVVPNYEEAVWVILRYHISQIASKEIDALDGLKELITEVYEEYNFHAKAKEYLGDSHGIEHLIGLYWSYDDTIKRPTEISINGKYGEEAIEEVKKEIVIEAEKWVARFCTQNLQ